MGGPARSGPFALLVADSSVPGPTSLDLSEWVPSVLASVIFPQPLTPTVYLPENGFVLRVNGLVSEYPTLSVPFANPDRLWVYAGGIPQSGDVIELTYDGSNAAFTYADLTPVPAFTISGTAG